MVTQRKCLSAIACMTPLFILTLSQSMRNAITITLSTAFFGIGYAFLKYSRLLTPTEGKLGKYTEAEWRSRILGSIHATVLTIGSIISFLEWPTLSPKEGWVMERSDAGLVPIFLSCFFAGYLHWDLCWLVWHNDENHDPTSLIHHTVYISSTHYLLHGPYFIRPFAWCSFTEISTPFLHLRWFLAVEHKKNSPWYMIWSLCFAGTFLLSRVLFFSLGIIDIWKNIQYWGNLPKGIYGAVLGLHCGWVLNLVWSKKVISAVLRSLSRQEEPKMKK